MVGWVVGSVAGGRLRPGRLVRLALVVLLVALTSGCAHRAPQLPEDSTGPAPMGLAREHRASQHLFRVHYEGEAGSGTMRLVVKIEDTDNYQIEARDLLGRSLWRLGVAGNESVMLDERRQVHCRSSDGLRVPEIALESLPLHGLPAILLGRLPGDLTATDGRGEYVDSGGRRWTTVLVEGRLEGWTVWTAGEPWLWWRRSGSDGGILSHRAGTQFRSKHAAGEPLVGGLPPLEPGDRSAEIPCEAWGTGSA